MDLQDSLAIKSAVKMLKEMPIHVQRRVIKSEGGILNWLKALQLQEIHDVQDEIRSTGVDFHADKYTEALHECQSGSYVARTYGSPVRERR